MDAIANAESPRQLAQSRFLRSQSREYDAAIRQLGECAQNAILRFLPAQASDADEPPLSVLGDAVSRELLRRDIIDGERRILCMTLGALAELETAFGIDNIADLAERFAGGRIAARDVMAIIAAGLRGGGNVVDDDEIAEIRVEGGIGGAISLAVRLLDSAFSPEPAAPNP